MSVNQAESVLAGEATRAPVMQGPAQTRRGTPPLAPEDLRQRVLHMSDQVGQGVLQLEKSLDDNLRQIVAQAEAGELDGQALVNRVAESVNSVLNAANVIGDYQGAGERIEKFVARVERALALAAAAKLKKAAFRKPHAVLAALINPSKDNELSVLASRLPRERWKGLLQTARARVRKAEHDERQSHKKLADIKKGAEAKIEAAFKTDLLATGEEGVPLALDSIYAAAKQDQLAMAEGILGQADLAAKAHLVYSETRDMPIEQRLKHLKPLAPKPGDDGPEKEMKRQIYLHARRKVEQDIADLLEDPAMATADFALAQAAAAGEQDLFNQNLTEQMVLNQAGQLRQAQLGVPWEKRRLLPRALAARLGRVFLQGDPETRLSMARAIGKDHGRLGPRAMAEIDLPPALLLVAQLALEKGARFDDELLKDLFAAWDQKEKDLKMPEPEREALKKMASRHFAGSAMGVLLAARERLSAGDPFLARYRQAICELLQKFCLYAGEAGRDPEADLLLFLRRLDREYKALQDPGLAVAVLPPGVERKAAAKVFREQRAALKRGFFKGLPQAAELHAAARDHGVWVNLGQDAFVLVDPMDGAAFAGKDGRIHLIMAQELYGPDGTEAGRPPAPEKTGGEDREEES